MFVVTVHVSDRTDCVFPLWCVCALIRTFAGPATLSAGAPETAPVRCSLERCKQPPHLTTPHSLASLAVDVSLTCALLSLSLQCLLFEAAEGGKTDTLKKIIDKCQEVGVSLNEPLGLEPSQTE